MRFWQNLSWLETEQLVESAKYAEQVGFVGVMDGDHVAFPVPLKSSYPYGVDGAPPMSSTWNYPDNFASAAAIGAVTTKLRYLTSVFVLGARNPLMVAKAAGTTAILTDHRFDFGVAAGWMKEEFDMGGVDFHTRGKRLDEMIEAERRDSGAFATLCTLEIDRATRTFEQRRAGHPAPLMVTDGTVRSLPLPLTTTCPA